MTSKTPWHCPNCGSLLILKEGRYGRFMACPSYPECRYTRALWTYQNVEPHCDKCNGVGLLPFIKGGKTIPNAFIDCACKSEMPDHYQPVRPEDIDFPVSYSYYRSLCECHGWPDPGSDMPEGPRETDIELRLSGLEMTQYEPGSVPKWYLDRTQQLEGRVLHTESKIEKHLTASKRKQRGPY